MAKVIDPFIDILIAMKGSIDLNIYCPDCNANEFHSCIGTSCAHCGTEKEIFPSTQFNCSPEEKKLLLLKADNLNKNIVKVGLSAFNLENQYAINEEFDRSNNE